MIELLAIPVINRPDLLARCISSIDEPVKKLLVIDNSEDGIADYVERSVPPCVDDWFVCVPAANLGFGGSVNHAICSEPGAAWWCIANADVEFGKGDLARLAAEMAQGGPRWVGINDWRVFGLSREAVERVGLWDGNLFPAYDDDCDYERRCDLAGVPHHFITGGTTHEGSASIKSDARYAFLNATRTHPSNRAYYVAKWGGPPRGGERFTTPFDRGGSVADWTLDIRRLRDNAW